MVAIYSTFLQRGYDQLIHDVALQNLPVLFAIDRAGLVGGDGATHNGSFDLSFLRCIPNLVVMAPADENECRQMLYTGTSLTARWRCAIRAAAARRAHRSRDDGAAGRPRRGAPRGQLGTAAAGFGTMLATAQSVAEALDATLVNMRFVKPLDEALLASCRRSTAAPS